MDGEAGTRSWSQYDVRVLYHTYDVAAQLRDGGTHFQHLLANLPLSVFLCFFCMFLGLTHQMVNVDRR